MICSKPPRRRRLRLLRRPDRGAERARGLLLPEHQVRGGAHTRLMPLRLRELVERELYRLGGAGTSSQVMNSGGLRELHAPGCATPQGLSMLEKADPSSVQSLESRIDALFASLLGEKPLPRTVAPVIVPTSPSALQPQTPTPAATPGVSAESADPSGYAEELARMKGSTPELQPAEPDPEFEAMADALDAETNAGLAELQRRRIYAQVNPEGV